jgi:hypothetical protein
MTTVTVVVLVLVCSRHENDTNRVSVVENWWEARGVLEEEEDRLHWRRMMLLHQRRRRRDVSCS